MGITWRPAANLPCFHLILDSVVWCRACGEVGDVGERVGWGGGVCCIRVDGDTNHAWCVGARVCGDECCEGCVISLCSVGSGVGVYNGDSE